MVEPLSNREKEVLKLMADGLSNSEIAVRLYLESSQNIFGKLNVHNRVQAVNTTREFKLI